MPGFLSVLSNQIFPNRAIKFSKRAVAASSVPYTLQYSSPSVLSTNLPRHLSSYSLTYSKSTYVTSLPSNRTLNMSTNMSCLNRNKVSIPYYVVSYPFFSVSLTSSMLRDADDLQHLSQPSLTFTVTIYSLSPDSRLWRTRIFIVSSNQVAPPSMIRMEKTLQTIAHLIPKIPRPPSPPPLPPPTSYPPYPDPTHMYPPPPHHWLYPMNPQNYSTVFPYWRYPPYSPPFMANDVYPPRPNHTPSIASTDPAALTNSTPSTTESIQQLTSPSPSTFLERSTISSTKQPVISTTVSYDEEQDDTMDDDTMDQDELINLNAERDDDWPPIGKLNKHVYASILNW